jgi:diguanylate cyclase (GGDEF)-like protein
MVDLSNSNRLSNRLGQLKISYSKRLTSEFEQLRKIDVQHVNGALSQDSLNELHSILHKMSGAAGTFGFRALGQVARELEQQVAKQLSEAKEQPKIHADWLDKLKVVRDADSSKVEQSLEAVQQTIIEGATTILLVERDSMLANYAESQLNSFGFKVICLSDARELEKLDPTIPNLLLIDHHAIQAEVRDTNLADIWKAILNNFDCPVFFTGAEESFNARLQALRAGGDGYFVKPLDMIKLASKITRIIRVEGAEPARVMIIEDDKELATHCQSVLEKAGMSVISLDNPECLFDNMVNFNPELLLMDLWLPGVSGAELAALIVQTERWAHLPIIYLSGESNPDLRNQALLRGGDAFLEKPVDMDLLVRLCWARVHRMREFDRTRNQDSLTGLLKHGSIKEALLAEWQLAQRRLQTFTVAMLDIDHFKAVNDTYGHAVGDLVIAALGALLRQHFRATDKLGRYGGEEFTLVLPDCDVFQAESMINLLREHFAGIKFAGNDKPFSCTISAGIADNKQFPSDTAENLLERADKALYRAKNSGRNRVVLASD